jgi:hypothetical protein
VKIKELVITETQQLSRYLDAVGDFLQTGEIRWYFEVRLFEVDQSPFDLIEFLKEVYPRSKPRSDKIYDSSLEGIRETLGWELGRFASKELRERIQPVIAGTGEMWLYLQDCIDLKNCQIYEYTSSERDEILNGLMGELAVFFFSEKLSRCLILVGATSD